MSRTERPAQIPPAKPASAPPRFSIQQLVGNGNEALIEHGGGLYRLRVTRNGKLILTK